MVAVTIMSDIPPQLKKIKMKSPSADLHVKPGKKEKKETTSIVEAQTWWNVRVPMSQTHTNVELELLDVAHRGEEDKSDCAIGVKVVSV